MRKTLVSLAALGTVISTSACAPMDEDAVARSSDRQCFFASQIRSYSDAPDGPDGENRLYIETGRNKNWLFETFGPCHELDFAFEIALDTSTSSVCIGDMETLLVPSMNRVDRCSVRLIDVLTDDQRDAARAAQDADD